MTDIECDPTLSDLLSRFVATETGAQLGGMPAQVTKYTTSTQRCDAKPLIQMDTSGSGTLRPLPICRDVPVQWPSGAGWALTGPMAVGDTVWLKPAGGDIGHWAQNGTPDATGCTPRRGSLSDVVAEPGLRPATSPLTADQYSATALVLACSSVLLGDSTATDFVALASLVQAELASIALGLSTHVHPGVTPGPSSTAVPVAPPYTAPASSAIAATKVKAK